MDSDVLNENKESQKLSKEKRMELNRNILLAKKYMVDSIYRSANIEGICVTFPETQVICEGLSVAGHTIDEINAVYDLKRAWEWLLKNIKEEVGLSALKKLNRTAGKFTVINAGIIRTEFDEPIRVNIGEGKYYIPPIPPSNKVLSESISSIIKDYEGVDASLELFCYVAKGQFFMDGNKRTATLICNMNMIKNGQGILSIPVENKQEFYTLLARFYGDDANKEALKTFLREHCITCQKEYSIGKKIAIIRKQQEFSRQELSQKIGISEDLLFAIERGEAVPTAREITAIENLFDVKLGE